MGSSLLPPNGPIQVDDKIGRDLHDGSGNWGNVP